MDTIQNTVSTEYTLFSHHHKAEKKSCQVTVSQGLSVYTHTGRHIPLDLQN